MAINTHDPQAITNLLHMFPYHIDSLLQLSEVYKASGNSASAADFIGKKRARSESHTTGFSDFNKVL
jgi:hypothetical protein